MTRAQAEAEVRNTAVLQRGGSPKWALQWLRARAPKNWPQPSTKVEIKSVHTTPRHGVFKLLCALVCFPSTEVVGVAIKQ